MEMREKLKQMIEKCRPQKGKNLKIWFIGLISLLVAMTAGIVILSFSGEEKAIYRETQVKKGNLAKGVTESGSVDVGTATQTFDLDISEFTGSESFTFGGGGTGGIGSGNSPVSPGGDMMMGMMSGASAFDSVSGSSADRQLEIEQVYVEAGQEVEAGTPILKLTKESVDKIRTELSLDVTDAQLVYQQALTSQKQTETDAEGDYKMNALYAAYSRAEYDETISTLTEAVEKAEETLADTEEELAKAQEELAEKEALLAEEKKVLENALFTAEGTDKENALYWWIIAQQTAADARQMTDTLEEEIGQLKEDMEEYSRQKTENETALALARKDLESGEITARGELDKRAYYAQNAQEIYDVAIEQSVFSTDTAREEYEKAVKKLEEFDSVIVEQVISADNSGVITEVYVAAALGNTANVTLAAFEDEIFAGTVTEIGDAEIDSNTNKTMYSVTVTVSNTGDALYQDMTAEVTFVTDQVSEVLYVPVRTVTEENGESYVKVREKDGTVVRKKVTAGFSDGINIEIKEGLSEGETVLTESKVKD